MQWRRSLHTRTETVEATLRWLEHQLAGLDSAGPEDHWDRVYYRLSRQRSGMALISALSAVDIAFWDIGGKRRGVPVWRLLGGPIYRQSPRQGVDRHFLTLEAIRNAVGMDLDLGLVPARRIAVRRHHGVAQGRQ